MSAIRDIPGENRGISWEEESSAGFYTEEVAYYGDVGLGTILSRAWILFKKNMKACLLLMLLPAIVQIVSQLTFTLPSYLLHGHHHQPLTDLLLSTILLSGPAFLAASFFLHILCAAILIRILDSAIVRNKPISIRESLAFMMGKIPILLLWLIISSILYLLLSIADVLIILAAFIFVGGLLSRYVYPWLFGSAGNISILIGGLLLALLIGAAAIMGVTGLFGLELGMGIFPLLSFCVSKNKPVSALLPETFVIIFRNAGRIFMLCPLLFVLFFVIAVALQGPLFIWAAFESYRIHQFNYFPMHVSITLSIVSNLINIVISGYLWSILTLFWHHARIASEGLDIQQRLKHLRQRLRRQRASVSQPAG